MLSYWRAQNSAMERAIKAPPAVSITLSFKRRPLIVFSPNDTVSMPVHSTLSVRARLSVRQTAISDGIFAMRHLYRTLKMPFTIPIQSVSMHIPPSGRTGVLAVLHGRFGILMWPASPEPHLLTQVRHDDTTGGDLTSFNTRIRLRDLTLLSQSSRERDAEAPPDGQCTSL